LRSIQFTSPNIGYVVGNENVILKYAEVSGIGGQTETPQINLFPNPAREKFQVEGFGLQIYGGKVEIYDLNGRKLLQKHIPTGTENIEVDVSHLKNGVYFCRLISEKYSTTQKLIIQK
jgi:hypothetical protein